MNQIIDFLVRAKKATYAGKGPKRSSTRPNSCDLEYSEGELKYIDTYLGGERFAGEEALWKNNIPIWAMNYCGKVVSSHFNGDFLKEALANVPTEFPYRGPSEYKSGDYVYSCQMSGDFEWFQGREEYKYKDELVYECVYHGGSIK